MVCTNNSLQSIVFILEIVARCDLTVRGSALRSRYCPETRSSWSPWTLSSAESRYCASSAACRWSRDEERVHSQAQRAITSGGFVLMLLLLWLVVGCRSLRPLVCVRNSPLFPQLPKTRENWSTQRPPLLRHVRLLGILNSNNPGNDINNTSFFLTIFIFQNEQRISCS